MLNQVVFVGGGTAGWMTAAYLMCILLGMGGLDPKRSPVPSPSDPLLAQRAFEALRDRASVPLKALPQACEHVSRVR